MKQIYYREGKHTQIFFGNGKREPEKFMMLQIEEDE